MKEDKFIMWATGKRRDAFPADTHVPSWDALPTLRICPSSTERLCSTLFLLSSANLEERASASKENIHRHGWLATAEGMQNIQCNMLIVASATPVSLFFLLNHERHSQCHTSSQSVLKKNPTKNYLLSGKKNQIHQRVGYWCLSLQEPFTHVKIFLFYLDPKK